MNRSVVFLFLQCLFFFSKAQYTVFLKGDKYGIKKGEELIIKPKYTTILPGDGDIFAVERKGRWQYIKPDGRVIYDERDTQLMPFEKGYGLVSNADGNVWITIDTAGRRAGTFFEKQAPEICAGKLLFSSSKKVYGREGTFLFSYDTLIRFTDDLLLFESIVEKGGSKKVFGLSMGKTKSEIVRHLLIKGTGRLVYDVHRLTALGSNCYYLAKGWPVQGSVIDAKGQLLFGGLTGCTLLPGGLCLVNAGTAAGVIDPAAKRWLADTTGIGSVDSISGAYWLGAGDRSFSYVVSGTEIIKINACYKQRIDASTVIAEGPEQMYVCINSGKLIAGGYTGFYGEVKDTLLIAFKDRKYVYLNIETGKEAGPYRDLYYAKGSRSAATKGQQLMKAALFLMTIPVYPLVKKSLDSYDSYESYIYTANYPSMYSGGLAIIGAADKADTYYKKDSLFLQSESALKYYYINRKGEIVSPGYGEAMAFANGWAWVKDSKGFFRIGASFEPLDKNHYAGIEEVWNGEYYVVEKGPFNKGLMDKNGKLIAPARYDWFETANDRIIGKSGGEGTVIVTK